MIEAYKKLVNDINKLLKDFEEKYIIETVVKENNIKKSDVPESNNNYSNPFDTIKQESKKHINMINEYHSYDDATNFPDAWQ